MNSMIKRLDNVANIYYAVTALDTQKYQVIQERHLSAIEPEWFRLRDRQFK